MKGYTDIGYSHPMAPLAGIHWEVSLCGCMHTNTTAHNGKPYPIQGSRAQNHHLAYALNGRSSYILEVL